jgi:uncharacterized protein (TIGR02466 family)
MLAGTVKKPLLTMNAKLISILQKSVALFEAGEFASALTASQEAADIAPGHPEALHMQARALGRLGRVDEASPLFDAAAEKHPQRYAILANKGNALRAAGRFHEAIVAYSASVAANPNFVAGWGGLGAAYSQVNNPDQAEGAFRKGLTVEPKNVALLNNLGALLVDEERREEAIKLFSAALAMRPDMVSALVNRGAALRSLGQTEEALVDHRKAARLAPENPEAQHQLANSLRQARFLADAESAYHVALRLAPGRADMHGDLARMLWEVGEGGRFLSVLNQAINVRPSPALWTLKGDLCFRAGLLQLAETAASKAILMDPERAAAHRLTGQLRRHVRDYATAIKAFKTTLKLAPADFTALHEMIETYLAQKDYSAALEALKQEPPRKHLQKHIALKVLAMRLVGDQDYRRYYDYERFVKKIMLEPPEGFGSLGAFNEALVQAIMPMHATKAQPLDQTLYGGTQSFGRLWDEPHPVIQAFKNRLLEAAGAYVAGLPDDPEHPFLVRKSSILKCMGAWSVVLSSGGGHVDHIHPEGWISAAYYVRVPEDLAGGEKAGYIRFGASGVQGVELEADRWVRPEEGAVVFFPSYMWHGVEKFVSSGLRITAPFDLTPC